MDNTLLYSIESFPPLRESITKINALCSGKNIDVKAFTRIIESDPVLYIDILHFSNAPRHGFRHPITSISQAISLFGIPAIRGMAITAALKAHPFTDLSAYGITMEEWFKVMEIQQQFLELWLGKKHPVILQQLGGLTFVLEIGRLVAAYVLMFTNNNARFTTHEPLSLLLEEKKVIGNSGDELAAKLFQLWYFDDTFVDALRYSMNPAYGLEPQTCAALMCTRFLFALDGIKPFEDIEPLLERFDLQSADVRKAYTTLVKK